MRGLMGSFGVMPLQEVIEFLARRRVTGTFTCERGAVRKSCHLVEGVVVEAASNDPREYLGQLLINFGHVTEEQLARAFEVQQETKVRLGRVLVMVGIVTPDVVRDTLAIKIRETLLDTFLWDSGVFTLEDAPPRQSDDLDARVDLAEVAREAEFRASAWQAFRAVFATGTGTLEVDDARAARADAATANARILQLAREGKTIDEIGVALHATDFHLYQRLYALWTQGVVKPAIERDPGAGSVATAEAAAALSEARAHLAAGKLAQAEAAAERALGLEPGFPGAPEVRDYARVALARELRAGLLDPPRTPTSRLPREEIARAPLAAVDRWLLARCDGTRDTRTLVRIAPAPELDVLRALRRLVEAKAVDLRVQ
jgi:hypothetical protein